MVTWTTPLPTIGASRNTWGNELNTTLTEIRDSVDAFRVFNVSDYGPIGTSDDSATIQAAITAAQVAGGIVRISDYHTCLSRIDVTGNNVTLEGAPGATIDFSAATPTGSARIGVRVRGTLGSPLSLSSNGTKGTYSVVLSATTGLAVGDWVRISSAAEYAYDTGFTRGEIKRIRLILGSTITFEQALYDNYATADTSVVAKLAMVEGFKVRGVTFKGADVAADADRALVIEYAHNFNVTDCEFENSDAYSLHVRSSVVGDISHNRFRGTFYDGVTGTAFYGIILASACQWVRVHANHGERVRHLVVITAGTGDPGAPRFVTCTGNVAQNLMAGAAGRSWAFEHHGIGDGIVFANNVADGCYGGFVTRGPGVMFINNIVRNWYAYAIQVHSETEDATNIVLRGNMIGDRTTEGGGFATPIPIRLQLDAATVIRNIVVDHNIITQDVAGQPAIKVTGTLTASSFVIRDNIIAHPSASVTTIQNSIPGTVQNGNVVNGTEE